MPRIVGPSMYGTPFVLPSFEAQMLMDAEVVVVSEVKMTRRVTSPRTADRVMVGSVETDPMGRNDWSYHYDKKAKGRKNKATK